MLLPILTMGLGAAGVIPTNLLPLIGASGTAVGTLIANLTSGKKTVDSVALAALQAVKSEIDALKTAGVLVTLNQANEINALDAGMSDAITAYEASLVKTDPSNLTALPESFPSQG